MREFADDFTTISIQNRVRLATYRVSGCKFEPVHSYRHNSLCRIFCFPMWFECPLYLYVTKISELRLLHLFLSLLLLMFDVSVAVCFVLLLLRLLLLRVVVVITAAYATDAVTVAC